MLYIKYSENNDFPFKLNINNLLLTVCYFGDIKTLKKLLNKRKYYGIKHSTSPSSFIGPNRI